MTRSKNSLWRLMAIFTVLGLLVAACGGTDDGGDGTAEGEGAGGPTATAEAPTDEDVEPETDATPAEGGASPGAEDQAAAGDGSYVLGVSNTVVGNGWREQMICSIQAQAEASGMVEDVVVINENAGPSEQIGHIQQLISQGVDAILVNPASPEALNPAIQAASDQGIVVVAVDQTVTAESAYLVTNDQEAYGRIGAEWLFEQVGGEGTVIELRGADGSPADTARHNGFTAALENYPDIQTQQAFTGWDFTTGGELALEFINTAEVDGFWTSGQDYTVVNAFETAGVPYQPVVGGDTNEFLRQMAELHPDFVGAAVSNPAAIGGVGAAIALDVLEGEDVERQTFLEPVLWTMEDDAEQVQENYYPNLPPTASVRLTVEPYTTYDAEDVVACMGGNE